MSIALERPWVPTRPPRIDFSRIWNEADLDGHHIVSGRYRVRVESAFVRHRHLWVHFRVAEGRYRGASVYASWRSTEVARHLRALGLSDDEIAEVPTLDAFVPLIEGKIADVLIDRHDSHYYAFVVS